MQKKFQYQNKEVVYTICGEGTAVVLLHGFGEESSIFGNQQLFLQQYCKVIIPDIPGSGLSAYNNCLSTIDNYADCINALLANESVEQCVMLGHSMGGYITLSFAEKYQSKLLKFGFIHSTAFADSEEKKINRQRGIELIEEYGAYSFLKNTIPNLFSKQFKEAFPDKLASLIEQGSLFSKEALQQYLKAMMNRADKTNVLKGNLLPVLFVIGSEDVAAPLNDLKQQINLPICSYIHILDNVGHMSMWEAPDVLNNFLLEFITN